VSTIQFHSTYSPVDQMEQMEMNSLLDANDPTAAGAATSTDPADGSPPPAVYLTPEALMTYCETRLDGIDSQITTAMTQQQSINSEQTAIQGLLTNLSTDSANIGTGVMDNPTECKNLAQEFENAITNIQANDPTSPALAQLEQVHDALMATGSGPYTTTNDQGVTVLHGYYNGGDPTQLPTGSIPPANVNNDHDGTIGSSEFTTFTNALTSVNSSLGSKAELQMINIQSLMSQRTTAIQLTTNILQAYDDGLSKVTDNIGK
jgi:hypothetical protein